MARDARDTKPEGGAAGDAEPSRAGHLGFVAHEIRNPLSTALWTAEMLARMTVADRGGARGEKLSAMCLRAVARVRQLVEDHLLCERLDAGGLPARVEAVGVREALDVVLEKHAAEKPDADADPSLGVEVDRGLFERALEALVAVAGTGGTHVTVTARATDREVALIVTGRPAEEAAMADPVKGAPSDATGRALAVPLVRRLAAALGGALAVQGGSWLLTVPRAQAYTPRSAAPVPP
ncbi:MAG TPA: histidine kinase dimerization/phospho-acceptor domain-containing protein [Anaeromyxobacter sp.]|nr:histidine kinase dimerization/phospho-acceptor domain-containing protein [Anaeromyxobacter sp.]